LFLEIIKECSDVDNIGQYCPYVFQSTQTHAHARTHTHTHTHTEL